MADQEGEHLKNVEQSGPFEAIRAGSFEGSLLETPIAARFPNNDRGRRLLEFSGFCF
jgi:hypothetical protein